MTAFMNGPTDPHGCGQNVPPVTICANGMRIGFVEEIHGEQGRPMPEYIPTRHELLVLAKYWLRTVIDIKWRWQNYGCVGSSELRQVWYGDDRVNSISDIIGDEQVRAVYDELMREDEERERMFRASQNGESDAPPVADASEECE